MSNVCVIESRRLCGRVCSDVFSGYFFQFFGLYIFDKAILFLF